MDFKYKLDILGPNYINVDQRGVIELTKKNKDSIDEETQKICRIIKQSHEEWNLEEILTSISELQAERYSNLFIFVIEVESLRFLESEREQSTDNLHKVLLNFDKSRSMVLQLTSKEENVTKIYYKDDNSKDFIDVNGQTANDDNYLNFPAFLCSYLNGEIGRVKELITEKWPNIQNSSLISKFLGILQTREGFMTDLLAATDGFFDENGEIRETNLLSFLSSTIKIKLFLKLAVKTSNHKIIIFLCKKCSKLIQQIPLKSQVQISNMAFSTNQIILYDLLEFCDFPFPDIFNLESITDKILLKIIKLRTDFQTNVLAENTEAIEEFAKVNPNLKFVYNLENKSALSIALDAKKFKSFFLLKALRFQDNNIDNFYDQLDDNDDKELASKLAGVQRRENVNISKADKDTPVLMLATRSFIYNRSDDSTAEKVQREKIKEWYKEIYNSKFGSKIIDVASQCKDLKIIFDFDCDSVENVDVAKNSRTTGTAFPISKWIFIGAKYENSKKMEQKIKGVVIHEVCHYVISMVYKNDDYPFYKDDENAKQELEKAVTEIKSMLFPPESDQEEINDEIGNQSEENIEEVLEDDEDSDSSDDYNKNYDDDESNDECDGILSNLFNCYNPSVYLIEIIVRPVQIQVQFDDNEEKLKKLELKYKLIFKFFEDFVVPELEKFCLEQRRNVQTFNNITGLLDELNKSTIEFENTLENSKNVSHIINNQLTIITTNIPKLLFLNAWDFLTEKYENLMKVKNIFIRTQVLNNSYISKSFNEILQQQSALNILVDCSDGIGQILKFVPKFNNNKCCFIVQTKEDCNDLNNKLKEEKLYPIIVTVNYNWMDLTPESQKLLLKTKVDFQSNSTFLLSELIDEELKHIQNVSNIVDDQLLKSLVEQSNISINPQIQEEINDNHFKVLFQSRDVIKVEYEEEEIDDLGAMQNEVRGDSFLRKFLSIPKFISSKVAKQSSTDETNNEVQFKEKTKKMTQMDMLEDVKNEKFVLISDKAGSGKSWILKNFASLLRENNPKKWISYVDLKQYIDKFKFIDIDTDIEFEIFMIENILKPKHQYEAEIFKHLYKNGKICIIFDGFDEIAPDCAELVTQLFQSFGKKGSNQLWIATRDYFKVDLKDDLQLDVFYKLDEFTEEQGVNLIKLSWLLSEIEDKNENLSFNDLVEQMKMSKNLQVYGKNAEELSTKVPKAKSSSIGFPQFYKMIADISKDTESSEISKTTFKMFEKCVDIQYVRWSTDKGKLTSEANIESQKKDLNFYKLHQLIAIESLFPALQKYCDLDIESLKSWSVEQIISCGMLCKKGDRYFFTHETFREFFAVLFILRILKQRECDEFIYDCLIQVLTIQKYGVIRMFLNEAFGESKNVTGILPNMKKIQGKFESNIEVFKTSSEIFEEGLPHLANFLITIFKLCNPKKVKNILSVNKKIIIFATKYKELLFIHVQKFIFDHFNSNELKEFLLENATFLSLIVEIQDEQLNEEFLQKVQVKIKEPSLILSLLQMEDERKENLLFYLIRSQSADSKKVQWIFKTLRNYLDYKNIYLMAQKQNIYEINFLHACVATKNAERTKSVLKELKISFKHHEVFFTSLVEEKYLRFNKNIMHISAECDKIEFHQTLWSSLLRTFDYDNLMNLINSKDKNEDNYFHCLIYFNNSEVIKQAFARFKPYINDNQYREILRSKGFDGRNLLQKVICVSKDIEMLKVLIKILRDSCKYHHKFLEILKEVDNHDNTVFHTAAIYSTNEVLRILMDQLIPIASTEEIKKNLSNLGYAEQNIFQSARCNKSSEFHLCLWEIMKKYFDPLELSKMIIHPDIYGDSLIFNVIEYNTKEIAELTWNEVKNVFNPDSEYEDLSELWIKCNNDFNSFLENKTENCLKLILQNRLNELIKMFKKVDCGVKLGTFLDPENALEDLIQKYTYKNIFKKVFLKCC